MKLNDKTNLYSYEALNILHLLMTLVAISVTPHLLSNIIESLETDSYLPFIYSVVGLSFGWFITIYVVCSKVVLKNGILQWGAFYKVVIPLSDIRYTTDFYILTGSKSGKTYTITIHLNNDTTKKLSTLSPQLIMSLDETFSKR